jgi:tagaturonate reductase
VQQLHRDQAFKLPIRIMQVGQGNFLRAFFDWQIDVLNERCGLDAGIVIVRPTTRSSAPLLDTQDGVYTTLIRGLNEQGQPVKEYRKIQCVLRELHLLSMYDDFLALAREPLLRFVVSNTTEAGIAVNDCDAYNDRPPLSFPAKLTRWLHERFRHFKGATSKGVVLLPCELIDNNGLELKSAIAHYTRLWGLESEFQTWLDQACTVCSTLVDRIVTGYPSDEISAVEQELGYRDDFLVAAEYYYLFVIEGPAWLGKELKLENSALHVQLVNDVKPYKQRKVGILNGGHTCLVPVALLAGLRTVGEAMNDAEINRFLVNALDDEIIPALPQDPEELKRFAADVLRRFRNPYIKHRLESIALNSWSKFAARVMPQMLTYQATRKSAPPHLTLALAATMHLYRGNIIPLADDSANLLWFNSAWSRQQERQGSWGELARECLANQALWKQDLSLVPGLVEALAGALEIIDTKGVRAALQSLSDARRFKK